MRISDWSSDVCSSYLYGTFVFVQTIRHRDYFLPPGEGDLQADAHASPPSGHRAVVSLGLLFLALLAVVLLAKHLAHPLEGAIADMARPRAFVEIGRSLCWDRVCQCVYTSLCAESFK